MRTIGAAVLFWCTLAGLLQPAYAQAACVPGPGKLGTARTFNVNTANGPHFGSQYKSSGFLADGEVVLTFDDGPSRSYTRAILDALASQCTKATFFMLGQMALADPQLVKEVARQGHTVATHTWSHANLQALPQAKAQDEIELGLSAVQHALGKPVAPFFRFPYLRDTPLTLTHLKSRQLAAFGIDIDSRDFETKDASRVYDRVMRELAAKGKGIVLFHDIHASTARAVPRILEELRAQGFRVVHVVPKAGAETLAEYDTLAQEAAERRRVIAAANPLAKRAVTWSSSISPQAHGSVAPPASPAPATHSAGPREDWTADFWRQSQ